ncbi:hypothetical protein D3C80_852860 [compost metagenome]
MRVIPVVIAAFANKAHLERVGRQFVTVAVGHQEFEFHGPVAIGLLTFEQASQARQALSRPDRLLQAPGDRPATRLLQAGLHGQLQRRAGFGPTAFDIDHRLAGLVKGDFVQFQVLVQIGFGDRAELVARQRRYCLAQRAYIGLTAQAVAGGRRTIEVTAIDLDTRIFIRRKRCAAALELQRQALGQEVFNEEFIDLLAPATQVEQQLPTASRGLGGQLQLVLVQAIAVGFPDELAAHLFIRATHFHAHRLGFDRLAVLVAQQAVEQHRLTRAVQVTRAEDEELQRVGLRPGDVEFGQVQGCGVQAQQRGMHALGGNQGIGLGRDRQLGMPLAIAGGLGQQLALFVMDFQVDAAQRLAAFQGLSKHVNAVAVAVGRHADVAEGEQGCRLRIIVGTRGAHHCQVHAWRLQRFDAGNRQQHGLARVARRV